MRRKKHLYRILASFLMTVMLLNENVLFAAAALENSGVEEGFETETEENIETEEIIETEGSVETDVSGILLEEEEPLAVSVGEAESAFSALLEEKDMMALIYLTDTCSVRSQPEEDSEVTAELESGHTVYLRGVVITRWQIWYQVMFWKNGSEAEGYVQKEYLAYADEDWRAWEEEYLYRLVEEDMISPAAVEGISTYAAAYADVEAFPAAYQYALKKLKEVHPNWTFVPMNTGLDFNTVVASEMGEKSLIQKTGSNAANGWVGDACPSESGWYYATQNAVAYYMNPCNFLTETYIFQFEQLTFNSSYHTEAAVQGFLNATFMSGKIPGDSERRTYAKAFYEIGKSRKLSPIHLASRVYQEQGQGNSALISGTYPGYVGYYNYFNIKASGSSTEAKIINGLTWAKEKGWNTRYKSLEGGAAAIGNNYILKGQDTIYLEKFNVEANSPHGLYNHQYMQNIQAPASEAASTKKMYESAGSLNSAFVFKIPVYNNMPGLKLSKTAVTMNKGDTLTLTASINSTKLDGSLLAWKSDNSSVVTVSDGVLTAQDTGTATITAVYEDVSLTCKVTVKNPLKSISLEPVELVLRRPDTVITEGELPDSEREEDISQKALQALFDPEDTSDDITLSWSSSNKKVATVDGNGMVTAVGAGEATITATAVKAGNKKAICKVRVIAPITRVEITNLTGTDTILSGETVNLTAEYWPKDTTSGTKVTWSSEDESVAVVTGGKVLGTGAGKTKIRAEIAGCVDEYQITIEAVRVSFLDASGQSSIKILDAVYGQTIEEDKFPKAETVEGKVFIGWYTEEGGTGERFDSETRIYGKETVLYPYYEETGQGFYVVPTGSQTYTGSAVKPKIQVYDGVSYEDGSQELIQLELNKDYTVSYKNNTKVNAEETRQPTITVKGKGNYSGTQYVYFDIVPKQLTDTDISASDLTVAYTGKEIKGSPTVVRNGKKLKKNQDYAVTYPQTGTGAYKTKGTYPIVITGKGGYTGSLTVYETITGDIFMSKVSVGKISSQIYEEERVDKENGTGIEPDGLTVTYKGKRLEESTDGISGDYTVKYENNMEVGTAKATITGVEGSGFTGSKTVTYKITGASIARADVTGITDKVYDGTEEGAWQENAELWLKGEKLERSTDGGITGDYTVTYQNTAKVGTAYITFKGVNEYTGTVKKSYKIQACDIGAAYAAGEPTVQLTFCTEDDKETFHSITSLSEICAAYMKGGTRPVVQIFCNGIALKQGKDYTISYKNNSAVTTEDMKTSRLPVIILTGKGNYKGKITGTFRITDGKLDESSGKIAMSAKDVTYKNKTGFYKTTVILKDANGKILQAGKDYEKTLIYTYAENTNLQKADGSTVMRKAGDAVEAGDIPDAGTAVRVTVQGKGAYAGDTSPACVSAVYHIAAADLAAAKVKVAAKVFNNGREVRLKEEDLTVTLGGQTLKLGTDYVIEEDTYANNVKKGKASVVLRGTGSNYGGTKKISFTIGSKVLVWWKNLF